MEEKKKCRTASSQPSSTDSMHQPPECSDESVTFHPRKRFTTASSEPSCISMKSTGSIQQPPELSDESVTFDPRKRFTTASSEPSCISMKSTGSIQQPPELCDRPVASDPSVERDAQSKCGLSSFADTANDYEFSSFDALKKKQKTNMKRKYESLFEGDQIQRKKTFLNSIYTQLYIIDGESERVNEEHEILQIEKSYTMLQKTQINCNDILQPLPGYENQTKDKVKTVLTSGIAGIGKSVSVQKFILDWAEGKANQDVDLMFVLSFRELNLFKDDQYSLYKLLVDFHPEIQDLDSKILEECKVVVVLDGLDESRITLMFSENESVSDVNESSSVGVLMSNLIRGELLPNALIWITSRPAATSRIPSKYINRLTEIEGFNDSQKEEYFRKRISDEHQASRIISHIKRLRSLHIMCHIPVFCWISSTVLQNLLKQEESAEIPKTLTEMYIHFLLTQMNMRNQKYEERSSERNPEELLQSNKNKIVKLAGLAFKQLMKGNVMFYEEDLIESGIDAIDITVYSGICTEIFKEESVIHQRKIYCFIHLSFQEFLAAFYVFYSFTNDTPDAMKVFDLFPNFHKGAIDVALRSENGHLDLFLRFLLGISLESNQRLLQGLLTHTEKSSESIRTTTAYIKDTIKQEQGLSADRSINLLLCLLEMNDQTLVKEIQEFMKSDEDSQNKLSPSHCSAIAYMLQMSDEALEELDLMKYNTSDEGRRRLVPAVMNCRKAKFNRCNLTDQCYIIVTSALQLTNSPLIELDLSNNDLQDAGVELICAGLKSPNCRLEILRLSGCMVTEEGCCHLVSALDSDTSHLRELDLSYNHPGEAGVQMFSALLKNPDRKLEKLNFDQCRESRIKPGLQKYFCKLTLDPNTANSYLALSEGERKAMRVEDVQPYPDHPDRFENQEQVLCRETLSERSYWEVEWSQGAYVAVTYKGNRKKGGSDRRLGWNNKSWSLFCTPDRFSAWHDNKNRDVHVQSDPYFRRVGVYVDRAAGTLSFYGVSDTHTLTHIHTFNTTFTEPLYAGFAVYGSVLLLE
ncbi:NLR family CARD domain-containing protein 3-like [Carassius auratus]|uniref:NLR family CARD domain-containing protein 3-like n=1 Tax=Carassius auratus TaxID=7957 RepID=A0A6P6PY11_CARAU|nr:NLR family CARD domain-containing protein 3-like [Carassius auratus]XP_026124956.1 NLR family CARD domain-containing protein 3-like [Carassius auratus]